jgi:hypothetical protein
VQPLRRRLLHQLDVRITQHLGRGELSVELGQLLGDRSVACCGRRPAPSRARWLGKTLLRTNHMPLVGAVLDVTADPLPVRLICVVALKQHVEAKPKRGIPDLLPAKDMDPAVDVFSRNGRLELLDAHEVLVVQRAQPIDGNLQLSDQLLELDLLHQEDVLTER